MSVTANITILSGVTETVTEDAIANQQVSHNGYDLVGLQLPTAAIPVTTPSFKEYALVAGTLTIDLTALLGLKDAVQNATGLKVQYMVIINPQNNANITVAPGASNGYGMDTEVVRGSQVSDTYKVIFCAEAFGDVGASAKNITITGTGSQTFKLGLLLG